MPTNSQRKPPAKRDPEGVRQDILRVASAEFAANGLSGARIDEIAARTKTSKRMIYYYFSDKEGLYKQCLEAAYARVRAHEAALDLTGLPADKALSQLVATTFEFHRDHPDFIRLVMIENIHNASHLSSSASIRNANIKAIGKLADIIAKGQKSGLFRPDLDAVELHWKISALCFFNVSNRPTFSALFETPLFTDPGQDRLRDQVVETILCFACKGRTP